MKLKTFNPENVPNIRSQKPAIGLNQKSGAMRFNKAIVEKIGAKAESQVLWHQDEENTDDWYLEIVKKDGFPLREKTGQTGEGGLVMQSTVLVRKIFESVAFVGDSGKITIANEPIKNGSKTIWPLITAMLKN